MYRNLYVSVVLAALVAMTSVACGDTGNPLSPSVEAPAPPPPPPSNSGGNGGGQVTALSVDPTRSEIPEGTSKMFKVTGGKPDTEPTFGLRVWGRVAGMSGGATRMADAFSAQAGNVEKMGDQHRYVSSKDLTKKLKEAGWDFDHVEIMVSSSGVSPAYTRVCYKGYTCNAPTN